jgi:hypothetical protein
MSDPDGELCMAKWLTLSNFTQYPIKNLQKDWEAPILDKLSSLLMGKSTNPEDKARLLAASTKESGAWLNATLCHVHLLA